MRFSRMKAKMRRGEKVLITCCHFKDPVVYEMVSLLGFDGIWLDLEHHATSDQMAADLMRASRTGASDIIVRPAKGEFMRVGRLLESGAQAIMYPRCESAEEATELVRWSKFAPLGERGIDGANEDAPFCAMPMAPYIKAANEHTLLIVQIESPRALEQVEAIAKVPGIDALMLGPGDMSVLSGIPFQFDHPMMAEATKRIAKAAQSSGKWWGTTSRGPDHSRALLDQGASFVCHGADILMVKQGMEQIQEKYAALGFTFANRLAQQAAELEKLA